MFYLTNPNQYDLIVEDIRIVSSDASLAFKELHGFEMQSMQSYCLVQEVHRTSYANDGCLASIPVSRAGSASDTDYGNYTENSSVANCEALTITALRLRVRPRASSVAAQYVTMPLQAPIVLR